MGRSCPLSLQRPATLINPPFTWSFCPCFWPMGNDPILKDWSMGPLILGNAPTFIWTRHYLDELLGRPRPRNPDATRDSRHSRAPQRRAFFWSQPELASVQAGLLQQLHEPAEVSVLVLHPGMTSLGNDPPWCKIARFYPEMCLNGVNAQWVYSLHVIHKSLEKGKWKKK